MITVFGSINLDLIARVIRIPAPGETVPGTSFATAPGGKGANQALAAKRAGGMVRLVGAAGNDSMAEQALVLLKADNVDLSAVRRLDVQQGIAMIMVGDDGENIIGIVPGTVSPGAGMRLTRAIRSRLMEPKTVIMRWLSESYSSCVK